MKSPHALNPPQAITRRHLMQAAGAAALVVGLGRGAVEAPAADPAPPRPRYLISACDWMMLKRQKLGAVKWAKECGLDGIEIDLGGLGDRETFDNKLLDPTVREQFQTALREAGLQCSSLAMSAFYAQSFAERPTVSRMIDDCIQTLRLMEVKVAFLPLGVRSDLAARPQLRPAVVQRLRDAGRKAEDAGVVI
ncbi:MAG: sugar phosphate isomerase/epimerase, partial [Phycisphaerae bacterium]|nr:sugar phosphate isomerase/epimerase [Phycisphaerae bacterium]MDW8262691.1 TIM barrel protein [Phycisphaerales bacterium]